MKRMSKITLGLGALALLDVFPAGALAQHFSEWSPPVNLGPTVNTEFFEVCPSVTKTGLIRQSLCLSSQQLSGLAGVIPSQHL